MFILNEISQIVAYYHLHTTSVKALEGPLRELGLRCIRLDPDGLVGAPVTGVGALGQ